MSKKIINKPVTQNWDSNSARTYILFSIIVCIIVMFGMAAAGFCVAQDCAPCALAWTLGVLMSIGVAFVFLEQVGDGKDIKEVIRRPLGWSWAQWGLLFSGVTVALVVTPLLPADSDDEKKGKVARVAGLDDTK
jgi:hypothetical protein